MAIKIIRKPPKVFCAECPHCFSILEYEINDVDGGYIQCPCCGDFISQRSYGKPVRESEDTE